MSLSDLPILSLGRSPSSTLIPRPLELGGDLPEEIVRQDDKNGANLPGELGVDPTKNRSDLGIRKIRWEGSHGFNVVEHLRTAICCVRSRNDLERRPRIIRDHVGLGSRVGVDIPSSKQLQNADPDLRFRRHKILDVDMLEVRRTLILTAEEEGPELAANSLGVAQLSHPHGVGDLGVLLARGGVLDKDDLRLPAHERDQDFLNVADGLLLPLLPNDLVGNSLQTVDDKAILHALILTKILQLGIGCGLGLEDAIQTIVILFKTHHPILENSCVLTRLNCSIGWGQSKLIKKLVRAIKEVKQELQAGVWCEVNAPGVELWGCEAGQKMKVLVLLLTKYLREQVQDLGQSLTIPNRAGSVHGRRNQIFPGRVGLTDLHEDLVDILEDGLDALTDRRRSIGFGLSGGQEVGDA